MVTKIKNGKKGARLPKEKKYKSADKLQKLYYAKSSPESKKVTSLVSLFLLPYMLIQNCGSIRKYLESLKHFRAKLLLKKLKNKLSNFAHKVDFFCFQFL